jgi:apoptotic chromatin condensation inducer in the nucleus
MLASCLSSCSGVRAQDVDEPKSLDDLFRKTETKPWLYWLPLTEAQAAEKAAAHGKASKPDAALPGPPPAHGK